MCAYYSILQRHFGTLYSRFSRLMAKHHLVLVKNVSRWWPNLYQDLPNLPHRPFWWSGPCGCWSHPLPLFPGQQEQGSCFWSHLQPRAEAGSQKPSLPRQNGNPEPPLPLVFLADCRDLTGLITLLKPGGREGGWRGSLDSTQNSIPPSCLPFSPLPLPLLYYFCSLIAYTKDCKFLEDRNCIFTFMLCTMQVQNTQKPSSAMD